MATRIKARDIIGDTLGLLRHSRAYFFSICRLAFVVLLSFKLSLTFSTYDPETIGFASAFSLILTVISKFVISTVLAVAAHRYVLLGETRSEAGLYTGIGTRELVFGSIGILIAVVAMFVLGLLAVAILPTLTSALEFTSNISGMMILLVLVLAIILGFYLIAVYLLVFPFVAIDKLMQFDQALKDLRNYRWLVFKTFLIAGILYIVPWRLYIYVNKVFIYAGIKFGSTVSNILWVVYQSLLTAYDFLATFFFVVIASLLYQRIGEEVMQRQADQSE